MLDQAFPLTAFVKAKVNENKSDFDRQVAALPSLRGTAEQAVLAELVPQQERLKRGYQRVREALYHPNFEEVPARLTQDTRDLHGFSEEEIAEILAERRENLLDIEHYAEHKAFRNLQRWLAGDDRRSPTRLETAQRPPAAASGASGRTS